MLRLIILTKRKYKKIEKQNIEPKEENGKVDITEMCSTEMKVEMIRAQRLRMTWTVTFHLKTMVMKKLIPHQSNNHDRRGRLDRLHKEKHS